jgi:hypothetical protein
MFATTFSCFGTILLTWSQFHRRICKLFVAIAVLVSVWSLARGLSACAQRAEVALFFIRLSYVGSVLLPVAFMEFTHELLDIKSHSKTVRILYAISSFILLGTFSSLFVREVTPKNVFLFYDVPGSLLNVYSWCFTILLVMAHYKLIAGLADIKGSKSVQIRYVLLSSLVGFGGSTTTFPLVFGIPMYPFGVPLIPLYPLLLSYAIVKHRLMDISIIIRRTLVYSTVMGILTGIYLGTITLFTHLFEGLAGARTIFSSAVAAALITICFQPLRKRVQAFVDSKFFRQYVDREEKLYELSREVITHTTPEAMGGALMRVIEEALHPKAGALYLRSPDGIGFTKVSSVGFAALPQRMTEDNELARYFRDHPQPFVQDLTSDLGQSQSTRIKEEREEAI